MSTLKTTNLQNADASSANIVLGQGSGGGATISGVTTSSTLRATTGIVTTATITTADVTTSRTTTGITTTATIDTATVGGVTTLNSDGVNSTGISTAKTFVPTEGQTSHRNLVINGAMQVAQRGTSSNSDGYHTVDRFKLGYGGENEQPTQYQGALSSSDTGPWETGFRQSYYVTNGNQTGGAGAGDYIEFQYKIEARDIASSGWDYTSSSSYITLSFWVKSSVAQNFYGFVYSADGTTQRYIFETGTLTANQWTKITKTIPGGTNVQFDDNNAEGLIIKWIPFYGTDKTNNSATVGSWANYNGAARCPDMTSTWWTTDNATFRITGVQLEVGSAATPFEHRSYGDEIQRCYRYYWKSNGQLDGTQPTSMIYSTHVNKSSTVADAAYHYQARMRTPPTIETSGTFKLDSHTTVNCTALAAINNTEVGSQFRATVASGLSASAGTSYSLLTSANTDYLAFSAEL